jgi:hypothetical protein
MENVAAEGCLVHKLRLDQDASFFDENIQEVITRPSTTVQKLCR